MKTMRETLAAVLLVAAACLSTPAVSQFNIPVVHHASADTAAGTLTLVGDNFGAAPGKAWLAKTLLTVQSWADKQIVATLPEGTAAGNHLVTVQTARLVPAFFVATIGGAAEAAPTTGRIRGQVTACGSRTLIYIPGRSYVVYTGPSGNFLLDNVPPGTYTVLIEGPGPVLVPLTGVTVLAGETTDTGAVPVVDLSSNPQHCGVCGNACLFGASCLSGQCVVQPPPPPSSCSNDAMCAPHEYCDPVQATCQVDLLNGSPCSTSSQCMSGNCMAGICM